MAFVRLMKAEYYSTFYRHLLEYYHVFDFGKIRIMMQL